MSINVNRNNPDPFYRYKMPRLIAKVEGKGNGIKTVIANMVDVAKALSRPPTYPTKFFGCELGAQTQFDPKNERYIVNGAHDGERLQELLDGFIRKFVLCAECENPETTLSINAKKGTIGQHCIACGHQRMIDMRHKVTTFMLRNPPDAETAGDTGGKKKRNKPDSAAEEGHQENEANAQEQSAAVRSGEGDISLPPPSTVRDEDVHWLTDTSEAAQRQRMGELTDAAASLAVDNVDTKKTIQERVDLFYNFVKVRQDSNRLASTVKEIKREADRLDVADKAPLILAELLLTSAQDLMAQLDKYKVLFMVFTVENTKAQKYLLGAFEKIVGTLHKDTLLPQVPHLLKKLYDLDILEETVLLDWSKKPSKKYVSKDVSKQILEKAAPFIKWLEEAEEESDEEEEDDDDELEVDFTNTDKAGLVKTVNGGGQPVTGTAQDEEDDDDEVNIDDI